MRRSSVPSLIGRILILAFFFILVTFPLYLMIITSFKTHVEITDVQRFTYFPLDPTFQNYIDLFKELAYGKALQNSIIVSLCSAIIVLMASLFGGYGLARFQFRGKLSVLLFLLVTQMIPGIMVLIPTYVIFSNLSLINTYMGLIIFYTVVNIPFSLITMRSFFERIPIALEEAARVDGCTKFQGLVKIVFPVMFPGIVAVFVFAFIGAWNELIAASVFTNTPDMATIPVAIKNLVGKSGVSWGKLMAGGVLALIPTALMFVFVQRFIVDGLTSGSVKE